MTDQTTTKNDGETAGAVQTDYPVFIDPLDGSRCRVLGPGFDVEMPSEWDAEQVVNAGNMGYASGRTSRGDDIAALLRELKAVEWSGWDDSGMPFCPSCADDQDLGHAPDCTLASAIRMAEGGAA